LFHHAAAPAKMKEHSRKKRSGIYLCILDFPLAFLAAATNNNNIHIKLKAAAQTNCLLKYNALALSHTPSS